MSEQPMIEAIDLTKRYAGRTAVAGISFTVARGEIVGLLGPNWRGQKHDDAGAFQFHAGDQRYCACGRL